MSKHDRRRVVVEVDMCSLGFQDLSLLTAAVATLEKLGTAGAISFSATSMNSPRKIRKDALDGGGALQPQAWDVLNFLRGNPGQEFTGAEVASATGVDQNSVRGQLHSLLRKGLVSRIGGGRIKEGGGLGRKSINTWRAVPCQG